jgi:NRAMP (natural resistance-associated macrophage protein)-like metal ion transporter
VWGVVLTALDVLLILALQQYGFRKLEAFIVALLIIIAGCFAVELALSQPSLAGIASGLIPDPEIVMNPAMLFIAIGIIGATVMPHNLYLHSSIVQTRSFERTDEGRREAIKFATLDSTIALFLALFINASILILAASTFHTAGRTDVAEIQDAYQLLAPMLGVGFASTLFAVALLASGQNSTITATLAGQIVMEGFLDIRLPAWLRRMITPLAGDHPGGCGGAHLRQQRHCQIASAEPGDPESPAAVRGGSAGEVYQRPHQDGGFRQSALADDRGLDDLHRDHRAQSEIVVRLLHHRRVSHARG